MKSFPLHPFGGVYLREEGSLDEMRWRLRSEVTKSDDVHDFCDDD